MRRNYPGFLNQLQDQLESLPQRVLDDVNRRGGFEISSHINAILNPIDYFVCDPTSIDSVDVGERKCDADLAQLGLCIDAGQLTPDESLVCLQKYESGTLLSALLDRHAFCKRAWIIVPHGFVESVERYVLSLSSPIDIKVLPHHSVMHMTPDNLLKLKNNDLETSPGGPGDVIPVMQEFNEIENFLASGGKHIIVIDGSNSLAHADDDLISRHLSRGAHVTCQVTSLNGERSCGVLCEHVGKKQIVETFKIDTGFEDINFSFRSTGTYIVRAELDFSAINWQWHRRKFLLNGEAVVKYQRYMDDVTRVFDTQFVHCLRDKSYNKI